MSTPALLAIIIAPFVIIAILLYFLTRENIWKPELLEAGEQILYKEEGVVLNIKSSPSTLKNLNVILTNKRVFLLRGNYRFITVYFDTAQYEEAGGKIKKSFSTSRYNLFNTPRDFQVVNEPSQNTILFRAKTYLGFEGQYELVVKDASAFKKIFSQR